MLESRYWTIYNKRYKHIINNKIVANYCIRDMNDSIILNYTDQALYCNIQPIDLLYIS